MKKSGLITLFAVVLFLANCAGSDVQEQPKKQITSQSSSSSSRQFGGNGGWSDLIADVAGGIFLGAENGVLFYAYDVLTYPKEPIDLVAKVQMAKFLEDVSGVTVGFYKGSELIGTARTNDYGRATLTWTPPEKGDYSFSAKITAVPDNDYKDMLHISPAPLLVAARSKETPFVVIDLDHTVVDSSFFRVLIGGAKPMADSVKVTKKIAKQYSIIYLTQRPTLLTRNSKMWLQDNRYPTGVLLLGDLNESLANSGRFKTSLLSQTKKMFPNIPIGIGDKPSDAQAYMDNGMVAYLLPHYKEKHKSMRAKAEEIRSLHGQDRLNVVRDWSQIEAGIFKSKQFPPNDFVRYLQQRAEKLQRQEQARKKREKEEDDDD